MITEKQNAKKRNLRNKNIYRVYVSYNGKNKKHYKSSPSQYAFKLVKFFLSIEYINIAMPDV